MPKGKRVCHLTCSVVVVAILIAAGTSRRGAAATYSWTQVTAAAPWNARSGHAVVLFHDKLWLMGGAKATQPKLHDVWSSDNGKDWVQVTAAAPWGARQGHQVVAFADKMWLLGGSNYLPTYGDVWCSSDGVNWDNPVPTAPWAVRSGHAALATDSGIWLLAGMDSSTECLNDVWFSPDGIAWTLVVDHAAWRTRCGMALTMFKGALFGAGGLYYVGNSYPLNDCWISQNGMDWSLLTSEAIWHKRVGHTMNAFDDRLWVLGGRYETGSGPGDYTVFLNDVWSSDDGTTWPQEPTVPWTARCGHASVVFDGKLWIMGGWAKNGSEDAAMANDVWYMSSVMVAIEAVDGTWKEEGRPLELKAKATGIPGAIEYQWMKDGSAITDATTDTYHVDAVTSFDEGSYTCRATAQGVTPLTADPIPIRVFPIGSLPVSGLTATFLTATTCLFLGVFRKRPLNHR